MTETRYTQSKAASATPEHLTLYHILKKYMKISNMSWMISIFESIICKIYDTKYITSVIALLYIHQDSFTEGYIFLCTIYFHNEQIKYNEFMYITVIGMIQYLALVFHLNEHYFFLFSWLEGNTGLLAEGIFDTSELDLALLLLLGNPDTFWEAANFLLFLKSSTASWDKSLGALLDGWLLWRLDGLLEGLLDDL